MTSSQPPQPQGGEHSPGGSPSHGSSSPGQPPPPPPSYGAPGQQPPPPAYGPPGQQPSPGWAPPPPGQQPQGWGQPQPGYGPPPGWGAQPGYGHQPHWGQQPAFGPGAPWQGQPGSTGPAFVAARLRKQDWVIAAGAIVYLVCLIIPWFTVSLRGSSGAESSTNGFSSGVIFGVGLGYSAGLTILAWVLLLLAGLAALSSGLVRFRPSVPMRLVAAGSAVLAFVFTLIVWIQTLTIDWDRRSYLTAGSHFSVMALITLVVSAAIAGLAVVDALPDLKAFQAQRASRAAAQPLGGQGYPGQQYPGQQYPGQGFPGQGFPGQGGPGQGYPGQGYPGQGYPPQPQWQQHAQPQQYAAPQPYGQPPFPPGQQPAQPPTRPQSAASQTPPEQHSWTQQFPLPQPPAPGQHAQPQHYAPPPPPAGEQARGGSTASGEGEGPRSGS